MEGNILYRYKLDQIELEGTWEISSEINREKFSYLYLNKNSYIKTQIDVNEINFENNNSNMVNKYITGNKFNLYICNSNIFEVLLIPNEFLFKRILDYLSGEYHGFFIYFSKTIEDRFTLNFSLVDHQVRVNGQGSNNLGEFNIIGFVNFYTMKDQLLAMNKVDSDVINFGMIKITRIYHAFDCEENTRVIKSYQHSRKKIEDEY